MHAHVLVLLLSDNIWHAVYNYWSDQGSFNMLCSTTITRQPISCDLSYATTIWYVIVLCVMCLLSSYSSVTSRSSKMSHFCLYQIQISWFIFLAACIVCMSSLLLSCWRLPWCSVFGCLRSLLFDVKMYFLPSITSKSPTNVSWSDAHLTPLVLLSFPFLLLMFKNKKKECVDLLTCWPLGWSEAVTMCIVGPCIFLYAAINLKLH